MHFLSQTFSQILKTAASPRGFGFLTLNLLLLKRGLDRSAFSQPSYHYYKEPLTQYLAPPASSREHQHEVPFDKAAQDLLQ